jgi:hypothetical protein
MDGAVFGLFESFGNYPDQAIADARDDAHHRAQGDLAGAHSMLKQRNKC